MTTTAPEQPLTERLSDLQQRAEALADEAALQRGEAERARFDYWPAIDVQKTPMGPEHTWVEADFGNGRTDTFLEDPNGSRLRIGWSYQPITRPTGGHTMSAMTMEAPVNGASTREAMREVLDEREASRALGDRLRTLPQRARDYVAGVFRYLRLNRAADTFSTAWERVRPILARILGPIKVIGILNIVGALLTAQSGRQLVRSAAETAARIITWPFRMAGRLLAWVGRTVGLGGAVAEVEFQWIRGKIWVRTNFAKAMAWLDEREHHGAMRWGRSFFQTAIAGRIIRRYAPENLRGLFWVAFLFVPNLGVGPNSNSESKFSVLKDTVPNMEAKDLSTTDAKGDPKPKVKTEKHTTTKTTVEGPEGKATATVQTEATETITKEKFTLLGGKKVTALKITAPDGTVSYKMNGQDYTQESLALVVRELSENDPEALPQMNRAVRRLIESGKITEEEAAKLTPEQISKL